MQEFRDGQVVVAWARTAVADSLVREVVEGVTGHDPGPVHHVCPHCGSVEHGRPYVDAPVDISIGHAVGLSVVAVSSCGAVGVDVEAADERDWVRTEAVAKAHGTGIVATHPSDSAWVADMMVPRGYVAAGAVTRPAGPEVRGAARSKTTHRRGDAAVDR